MFSFGIFLVTNTGQKLELLEAFFNIEDSKKRLQEHLIRIASNAESQATKNTKDGFHFFVENEKRALFVSRIYKNKQDLLTAEKARKAAAEKFYFKGLYFNFDSIQYIN